MARKDLSNVEIEIIPYDGQPNPRNPFDSLTPEDREQKIVEIYAKIYLRMIRAQNGQEVTNKPD